MQNATVSIVGQIYDAATNPLHWDSCLKSLATEFDAQTAQIGLRHKDTLAVSFLRIHGMDDISILPKYMELAKEDPLQSVYLPSTANKNKVLCSPERLTAIQDGGAWHCREALSEESLRNNAMYREVRHPHNIEYALVKAFAVSENSQASLNFSRGKEQAPFNTNDCFTLDMYGDHVRRALQIYERLMTVDFERRTSAQLLDLISTGIVIVGSDHKVVHANQQAQQIFSQYDGLVIHEEKVRCADPAADRALAGAISSSISSQQNDLEPERQAIVVERISSKVPFSLMVSAINGRFSEQLSKIKNATYSAIFIIDPLRMLNIPPDSLVSLLKISPAQARIAALLVEGKSVNEIAEENEIAPDTVRKHLKQIFKATNTGSQAELVRMILLAAPWFSATNSITDFL